MSSVVNHPEKSFLGLSNHVNMAEISISRGCKYCTDAVIKIILWELVDEDYNDFYEGVLGTLDSNTDQGNENTVERSLQSLNSPKISEDGDDSDQTLSTSSDACHNTI